MARGNGTGERDDRDEWQALAVQNNAEWCDVVARSHGAETSFQDGSWTSATRTPPLYPDAVTLVAKPPIAVLLSRVDYSPGCSVKDSFATLDLSRSGFRLLLEGQWVVHPEPPRSMGEPSWRRAIEREELAAWAEGWRGEGEPAYFLRAELLAEDSVAVVGSFEDGLVASGAILNRSAGVVGISNLFSRKAGQDPWRASLEAAASLFPGLPVVGWEPAENVSVAQAHGFESVGRLRVWIR